MLSCISKNNSSVDSFPIVGHVVNKGVVITIIKIFSYQNTMISYPSHNVNFYSIDLMFLN